MAQVAPSDQTEAREIADRLVRYKDLKPCTTAFIDTRTPGSAEKENFTIIGPGVAESPDQHVHIDIPHGFNIGGARQPPDCINSQHSHETAEVFVIHSGRWAFYLGPEREDGEVVLGPGDTISIPIHVFRGFKNVGDDVGFMFAVLGGDDPGHVTWAPYVFEAAEEFGLILLEDGSLVDTTRGETIPQGKKAMSPTTPAEVERMRRMTAGELAECVVAAEDLRPIPGTVLPELLEYPIIGQAIDDQELAAGRMDWKHGFHVRNMRIEAGTATKSHVRDEEEVILMQDGELTIETDSGQSVISAGDVVTLPLGLKRRFANNGAEAVNSYVVRGGDDPAPPRLAD